MNNDPTYFLVSYGRIKYYHDLNRFAEVYNLDDQFMGYLSHLEVVDEFKKQHGLDF